MRFLNLALRQYRASDVGTEELFRGTKTRLMWILWPQAAVQSTKELLLTVKLFKLHNSSSPF